VLKEEGRHQSWQSQPSPIDHRAQDSRVRLDSALDVYSSTKAACSTFQMTSDVSGGCVSSNIHLELPVR
jgi:hypothetical protein